MENSDNILLFIGQKIKGLRELDGLSQSELARRADVPKSKLGRMELGQTDTLDIFALQRIAKALEVPLTFFVEQSEYPKQASKQLQEFFDWLTLRRLTKSQLKKARMLLEILLTEDKPTVEDCRPLARRLISSYDDRARTWNSINYSKVKKFKILIDEAQDEIDYSQLNPENYVNYKILGETVRAFLDDFYVHIETVPLTPEYANYHNNGKKYHIVLMSVPTTRHYILSMEVYLMLVAQVITEFQPITLENTIWYQSDFQEADVVGRVVNLGYSDDEEEEEKEIQVLSIVDIQVEDEDFMEPELVRVNRSRTELRERVHEAVSNEGSVIKANNL
jgi:transcriptional regulator with XRE-family HTH domain